MQGDSKMVDFDQLRLAKRPPRDTTTTKLRSRDNYVGHMQQFVFNRNDFFEMARTGAIKNIHTNADLDKRDTLVNFPLTFLSPAAYLTTKLKLYSTFTIFFSLKTTQPDGLIMFSGSGGGKDFMAVELVNGHLRYIYDVGSGPRVVRSTYRRPLNDNEWHDITVLRPQIHQHIVRVDTSAAFDSLPDVSSVHFDMGDQFFVGGIEKSMYNALPKQVKSREGFQGCMADLDLDGDSRNILEHRANIPEEYRGLVVEGCEGGCLTNHTCTQGSLCYRQDSNKQTV